MLRHELRGEQHQPVSAENARQKELFGLRHSTQVIDMTHAPTSCFLAHQLPQVASRGAILALLIALAIAAWPRAVNAQKGELKVDWNDPEIQRHVSQSRTRAVTEGLFDPRLTQLRIPVLGFKRSLGSMRSVSPTARATPSLTMDPKNPVWYEISYEYADGVTVTIEADLRIQHKLPPGSTGASSARSATVRGEGEVSVFDNNNEVGMIGAIAEFQVYRFGVPYTVTVECTEARKAICQDADAIKRDQQLLEIVSARPPQR